MAASFSEDILTEILKRLPVLSLIRLMLVQKSWYRLIQSPDFNKALSWYHQNNTPAYILFHTHDCNSPISLRVNDKQCNQYSSLPFPQDFEHAEVLGISNGLICLSHLSHNPRPLRIFLWNPVIRKLKTSPRCPIPDPSSSGSFDATGLAFGYVHKMNDYKVINLVRPYDKKGRYIPDKIVVLVYGLSTNSWKTSWKTVSKGMFPQFGPFDKPVIVNGVAYWNWRGGLIIACFDIESETIREIMMPLKYRSQVSNITLVQNFSELFLFGFDYVNGFPSFLDIWLLGDADVWTHKFRLDLEYIEQDRLFWNPVCFMNNHEILLIRYYPYGFKSYDIEKGETTEIIDDLSDLCSALDIGPFTRGIGASPFVESLGLLGEESYT
ncbi:hypothetical protein ACET3Z_024115 [Daucus carota]